MLFNHGKYTQTNFTVKLHSHLSAEKIAEAFEQGNGYWPGRLDSQHIVEAVTITETTTIRLNTRAPKDPVML